MAFNFPNSPAVNDVFNVDGINYIWDGVKWTLATSDNPALGTAAFRNVPVSGNAGTTEAVLGTDTRLTNARTPLAHSHTISDVTALQAALDSKAATAHTHTLSNITQSGAAVGQVPAWTGAAWVPTTSASSRVVQYRTEAINNISFNNQMPHDNTLPLITEGTEIWSYTFTPVLTNSFIEVAYTAWAAHSASGRIQTFALFSGNTCVNAVAIRCPANNAISGQVSEIYVLTADRGNLNPITFSCRSGANGTGTSYVNQGQGGQAYSGAGVSAFTITEYIGN